MVHWASRLRRSFWWTLAGAGVLTLGALACYWFAPGLLTVDSGDCSADAIVVLGGDPYGRPLRAAELLKERAAPIVIVSGDGDCDAMVAALRQNGVPESVVQRKGKSRTTKENAEFSVVLLHQARAHKAIIVTSWFHSRRALNCFKREAPDIQFYSRPSYYAFDRSEWSRTAFSRKIRLEYIKILGYAIRYGIIPF